MKAIALDDEPLALHVLETYCKELSNITLAKSFTEPKEVIRYVKKFPVDLIFLDIRMRSMSGFEVQKVIPQNTLVIFTTAYSEHAAVSYELNAIDYLVKPFGFDRFEKAVKRATEYYDYIRQKQQPNHSYLFIRADYTLHRIQLNKIIYIEGLDSYIRIYIDDHKPIVSRMSMKAISEKLPGNFIRVHRSYILPLDRITGVRNKVIFMGETEIPIGSNYKHVLDLLSGSH